MIASDAIAVTIMIAGASAIRNGTPVRGIELLLAEQLQHVRERLEQSVGADAVRAHSGSGSARGACARAAGSSARSRARSRRSRSTSRSSLRSTRRRWCPREETSYRRRPVRPLAGGRLRYLDDRAEAVGEGVRVLLRGPLREVPRARLHAPRAARPRPRPRCRSRRRARDRPGRGRGARRRPGSGRAPASGRRNASDGARSVSHDAHRSRRSAAGALRRSAPAPSAARRAR